MKFAGGSAISSASAWNISPSTASRARFPAASSSASISPPRSARRWSIRSTCSTSRPSACIRATAAVWSRSCSRLRANQNTVVVVEHDPEIIKECDHIIDLGPRAGEQGGQIMFAGPIRELLQRRRVAHRGLSEPAQDDSVAGAQPQAAARSASIKIKGARANNLKNIDVEIPLGLFVCITGVSGSGKSSLVDEVLHRNLKKLKEAPAAERHRLRQTSTASIRSPKSSSSINRRSAPRRAPIPRLT